MRGAGSPALAASPSRGIGPRTRRATARAVGGGLAAGVAAVALVALAGPVVGAVGMAAAVLLLFVAACRVLAARERDVAEDRWLRQVLGDLEPRSGEDEDPGLLLY